VQGVADDLIDPSNQKNNELKINLRVAWRRDRLALRW
jgi:hypothetical protein